MIDITDNNNEGGPTVLGGTTPQPQDNNVVSLQDFKKQRDSGEPTKKWPSAVPSESLKSPVAIASHQGPQERKLLLSLTHGDLIMTGIIGLSPGFLAVGDAQGSIKFAAADGMWMYARDITNDKLWQDIEPPKDAS